jgi:hypothetical protein
MIDFIRGRSENAFAASPLFTGFFLQGLHRHEWQLPSNDPQTIDGICDVGQECGFIPFFESLWFELGVMDYDEIRVEEKGDAPDVLEGFQGPPSGNITDMVATVRQLPESIITKGNIDLNILLNSSPEEIYEASLTILEGMKGRRHIMGGSCSAIQGTPLDNFRAMVRAVETANGG